MLKKRLLALFLAMFVLTSAFGGLTVFADGETSTISTVTISGSSDTVIEFEDYKDTLFGWGGVQDASYCSGGKYFRGEVSSATLGNNDTGVYKIPVTVTEGGIYIVNCAFSPDTSTLSRIRFYLTSTTDTNSRIELVTSDMLNSGVYQLETIGSGYANFPIKKFAENGIGKNIPVGNYTLDIEICVRSNGGGNGYVTTLDYISFGKAAISGTKKTTFEFENLKDCFSDFGASVTSSIADGETNNLSGGKALYFEKKFSTNTPSTNSENRYVEIPVTFSKPGKYAVDLSGAATNGSFSVYRFNLVPENTLQATISDIARSYDINPDDSNYVSLLTYVNKVNTWYGVYKRTSGYIKEVEIPAGNYTLKVQIGNSQNKDLYNAVLDYISFTPIVEESVKVVDDNLTRIEFSSPLEFEPNVAKTFTFTVPKNGNYTFGIDRMKDYSAKGQLKNITITPKDGSATTLTSVTDGGNSGKTYARFGSIDLTAGTEYTLSITSTDRFTTNFIDILNRDITVDGKILIPPQYYTSATLMNGDNFTNNGDKIPTSTNLVAQLSSYRVIGSTVRENYLTTNYVPVRITPVMGGTKGHNVAFTINCPEDGNYAFKAYIANHGAGNVDETITLTADGTSTTTATWSANSNGTPAEFEINLTKGTHTIKFSREEEANETSGLSKNGYSYFLFATAEKVQPEVALYVGDEKSAVVASGNVKATLKTNNAFDTENSTAYLAIYDKDNKLCGVASSDVTNGEATVTINDFTATDGAGKYTAKLFVWGSDLEAKSQAFVLADAQTNLTQKVDFFLPVDESEPWREPVVLQITDPQIIDPSQNSEGSGAWEAGKEKEYCYNYLDEIITNTNPDLILVTGDIVYGRYDDNGTKLEEFVEYMESKEIPWAPVFGNHENESAKGADWQSALFENAPHCYFKQRELTGNGNYTVGIKKGDELIRVFFMLDSNGCAAASQASKNNGHFSTAAGFGEDQIEWFTETAQVIKALSPNTKLSFAYHIPVNKVYDILGKYGYSESNCAFSIDTHSEKKDGDFGYVGGWLKYPIDPYNTAWNRMKALGADSMFVGHFHEQSASVLYDGIRFTFGQKSSQYDALNYWTEKDGLKVQYATNGTPVVGGTVFKITEDGSIDDMHIYFCNDVDHNTNPYTKNN